VNKAEHKLAVKKVMTDHLKEKGWPNLTDQQVLLELMPMWRKLEQAKLILPGMTFKKFCETAERKALEAMFGVNMRMSP
jgi:hypothetical protein